MHAVRTASPHPVVRIAFSPCDRFFATAQPQHGVTLHDRATGAAVRAFGNPRRTEYTSLVFTRGGAWVAAAGPKGLEVYDAATGSRVGHSSHWFACGLRLGGPDERIVGSGTITVLEYFVLPDGGIDRRGYWYREDLVHHELAPGGDWAIGFREAGSPVAVDLAARRATAALAHPARVSVPDRRTGRGLPAAEFAATTPRAAICDGRTLTVFDLTTAEGPESAGTPAPLPVTRPRFELNPPVGWPAAKPWRPPFALTPDGRGLLVKRPRERVQLWSVDAGTLEAEWSWRLEGITCLAVAPDGLTAVAGGRFGRVLTWDLE
jgi:hypothetical protein